MNDHLTANKKKINITYNETDYQINFLDIQYGKKISEVCNEKSKSFSNHLGKNKWNGFQNGFKFDFTKHNHQHVKRLNTGISEYIYFLILISLCDLFSKNKDLPRTFHTQKSKSPNKDLDKKLARLERFKEKN